MERTYIAIDLKAFYASAECVQRGLNPLTTNLVVADESRTEKTICLAISPPLKTYGLGGRARLFEVVQTVRDANARRRLHALLFDGVELLLGEHPLRKAFFLHRFLDASNLHQIAAQSLKHVPHLPAPR